ncbi:microtubule-associated protein futsch [Nerophis ophidion]|uniref:microtubule-associated protein futsch n=1 Tax=Nerophis ophidion TaxID=159077 RepID=UPI002AE077A3|nr:microtubule-associated protein futsch [Nerophis ophidion]
MESNHPTLKRPKRKLHFLTNTHNPLKAKWAADLSLEDVDRMFDDLEPDSRVELPSTSLMVEDSEESQKSLRASPVPLRLTPKTAKCQNLPKKAQVRPSAPSPSPQLRPHADAFWVGPGPMKTSSPIQEGNDLPQTDSNAQDRAMLPVLFDNREEAGRTQPSSSIQQGDADLESPPTQIVLSKRIVPLQNKAALLKSGHKEPQASSSDRESTAKMSGHARKDMLAFLQKLRAAGQPEAPTVRRSLTPVKQSSESEDEFLIVEEVVPFAFSKRSRKSNGDKDGSTDKGSKDDSAKKPEADGAGRTPLKDQTIMQKGSKKRRENTKKAMGTKGDQALSPDDLADAEPEPRRIKGKKAPPREKVLPDAAEEQREQTTLTPVKQSSESEDEFLIVEDVPFSFSKRSRNSNDDKDGSTDKGSKDDSAKKPKADGAGRTPLKDQTVRQKASKKRRENTKKAAGTKGDPALSPEDLADAEPEPRKIKGKKAPPWKKVLPDAAEEQLGETASRPMYKEKGQKLSGIRRFKSIKDKPKTSKQASEAKNRRKSSSKEHADLSSDLKKLNIDLPDGMPEPNESFSFGAGSSEEKRVVGKRKRNPPGEWWVSSPQNTEQPELRDQPPGVKKSKQTEPSTASPVKARKERILKRKTKESKKSKEAKVKIRKISGGGETDHREDPELRSLLQQDLEPQSSSPLEFNPLEQQLFQRVYQHPSKKEESRSHRGPLEPLSRAQAEKRRRKPPGEWWKSTTTLEETEVFPPEPQRPGLKMSRARKTKKTRSMQSGTPAAGCAPGSPPNNRVPSVSKTAGGAPVSPPNNRVPRVSKTAGRAPVSPPNNRVQRVPKSIKSALGTFKDIFSSRTKPPTVLYEDAERDNDVHSTPTNAQQATFSIEEDQLNHESLLDSENILGTFRSGPSSLIRQEVPNDVGPLLSSPVAAELSVRDLCAPPLKLTVLEATDRALVTEWLRTLWPTTFRGKKGNGVCKFLPDHFDWYNHRNRLIGIMEDLHCGNISNGKMLLGSFMKKPLWVDHSATMVFNLLTSSIKVSINTQESFFHAGQSFMVPCGHAYSLHNLVAMPAVLTFTRMVAESPD